MMRPLSLLTLAVLLSGCAGYQLGPVKPARMERIETLAVPTFRNETLRPRLEVLVADTVIKQIQQDGTFRVVPDRDADAFLDGTIEQIERRSVRSVRANVLATREFEVNITIRYQIIDSRTGEILDRRAANGTSSFFITGDLQQDERQGIVAAAKDAAVRLVSQISEGW